MHLEPFLRWQSKTAAIEEPTDTGGSSSSSTIGGLSLVSTVDDGDQHVEDPHATISYDDQEDVSWNGL
jgi:hypothetical protein